MSNYFLRSAKPNLLTKNPSFEKGIKQNEIILKALIKAEIHCDDMWADIQVHGGIGVLEECAAALSSEVANGQILPTMVDERTLWSSTSRMAWCSAWRPGTRRSYWDYGPLRRPWRRVTRSYSGLVLSIAPSLPRGAHIVRFRFVI